LIVSNSTILAICACFHACDFGGLIYTISDSLPFRPRFCPLLASPEGIKFVLRINGDLHHHCAQLLSRCLTRSYTWTTPNLFMLQHFKTSFSAEGSSLCIPCIRVAFLLPGNSESDLELGNPFSMVCSLCVSHLYAPCYTGRYRVCFTIFVTLR